MSPSLAQDIENELRNGPEVSPQLEAMMDNARAASDFLKAMSHENRLLLLCLLCEKERSVGELETILALRQPTVSQQLARLRYDDLVTTRRDGKTIYYSIANENVRRLVGVIYDMFCTSRKNPNT